MRLCRTERIMDSKKLAKLHSIYGIILAVLVLVSGVCLAASALHIFLTGDAPHYSREVVGQHLLYIAAPLSLMVLATIGGVVLDWVHPLCNTERLRGFQNARVRVRRMSARMNISLLPCEARSCKREKQETGHGSDDDGVCLPSCSACHFVAV